MNTFGTERDGTGQRLYGLTGNLLYLVRALPRVGIFEVVPFSSGGPDVRL
jgi:hypothetical protein